MEYYSPIKSNKFKSVAVRWMHLESVSRSEVSQKENKSIAYNAFIWNPENGTDESICRAGIETHVEKRHGHSKGWRQRDKLRVAMTYMHYRLYKRELVGRCSTTEGAQTAVL